MLNALAILTGFGMQVSGQLQPSPILLIHRDLLKPENETAYREVEEDTARLLRDALPLMSEHQVQFPNPYLAVEPMTGPQEVWFLTGWNSMVDYERVGDGPAEKLTVRLELRSKGIRRRRRPSLSSL